MSRIAAKDDETNEERVSGKEKRKIIFLIKMFYYCF